ncbi:uridine kinase [Cellulomonas palmilytica]|nr:uridine kinase [Cellulomonas palmilytica]
MSCSTPRRPLRRGGGRTLIAVDGRGASGKSTFADALAARAHPRPVVVLHVDDFFHPPHVRHARGRLSPEGFWLDTYDYDTLVSGALEPLSRGGAGAFRRTGDSAQVEQAPDDALVVVEGTFLLRDELARFWDVSVFLDVRRDEADRRMRARGRLDEALADQLLARYDGAQRLYFAHASPWERATLVVDTTDPTAPVVVEASTAHAARTR